MVRLMSDFMNKCLATQLRRRWAFGVHIRSCVRVIVRRLEVLCYQFRRPGAFASGRFSFLSLNSCEGGFGLGVVNIFARNPITEASGSE